MKKHFLAYKKYNRLMKDPEYRDRILTLVYGGFFSARYCDDFGGTCDFSDPDEFDAWLRDYYEDEYEADEPIADLWLEDDKFEKNSEVIE